uniref:Uncharacterized protein n=1 Tax=Cacopsylla melanoneura TaxID=428564 RepID=A0A8D9ARZ7_9HEMI
MVNPLLIIPYQFYQQKTNNKETRKDNNDDHDFRRSEIIKEDKKGTKEKDSNNSIDENLKNGIDERFNVDENDVLKDVLKDYTMYNNCTYTYYYVRIHKL